jgi:hypothetical protein
VRDQPFYFEIKDLITQFVAAFNSVVINRYDKDRVPDEKKLRVSYVYAPKQRVIQDLVNKSMHLTLPVIAVTIGGIQRDSSRVFNKILGSFYANNGVGTTDYLPQPVPINITVNMSILTKYQTDMDFRNKEIARLTEARKKSYHSNPEVRAKMIQNAKDRYYRMKEAAARDKQE